MRDDRSASVVLRRTFHSYSFRREYITQEDLTKAARKVGEAKKHESKFHDHNGVRCVNDDSCSKNGVFHVAYPCTLVYHSTFSGT